MSNDSHLFKTHQDLTQYGFKLEANQFVEGQKRFVPLYEAKMVYLYNHRHGDFSSTNGERSHVLPPLSVDSLRDPSYLTLPYYWVSQDTVTNLLNDRSWSFNWLIGWRDVTDARASARTLISTIIPRSGVNDKFLLMLPKATAHQAAALLGNLCSLVCDYVARQKVGGLALKYFTMKQLPILSPDVYTESNLTYIVPRVLELTYTAHDLKPWAEDLGYNGEPFPFDPDRRAILRAELDALYAKLYGLTRDELRYILDPADIMGEDYPSESFRVLKNKELKEFGEYRTQRLVLEAWNKIQTGA